MWVRVQKVEPDGMIIGTLDNDPICIPRRPGSKVVVHPEEVQLIVPGDPQMTDEKQVFHPQETVGQMTQRMRLGATDESSVNWTSILAAALAGVTFVSIITRFAKRS
jgi:hypothetical protein